MQQHLSPEASHLAFKIRSFIDLGLKHRSVVGPSRNLRTGEADRGELSSVLARHST